MPDGGVRRKKLSEKLLDKLDALPDSPGVYLFKDHQNKIIYVGKAKVLRNRVRSYFSGGDDGRYQYNQLVNSIEDLEILLTRTELEALRTEANLIRLNRPRFNVELRDERSYPYLQITHEPFPRINLTRKPTVKNADYFGPYTDVKNARGLLRSLKRIFKIRDCRLPLTHEKIAEGKFKLCLDYHINRCGGPCEGYISEQDYNVGVNRFRQFLQGQHDIIIESLEKEMHEYSVDLKFERAADVRDQLKAIKQFSEKQKKVSIHPVNQDAIGLVREDDFAAFSVLKVRHGRIMGQSPFYMERTRGLSSDQLIEAFITRHYTLVDKMPEEIFLPEEVPEKDTLTDFVNELSPKRVTLHVPQRGEKHSLLNLAIANANHIMAERRIMAEKKEFVPRSIKALQEYLRLDEPPLHIEAFDISHMHGSDTVASMVMFRDGKPYKSGYRIYKIKSFEGIDDFAAIGEAVKRRYSRVIEDIQNHEKTTRTETEIEEGKKKSIKEIPKLPELILIDGGKGQLSRARTVLDDLSLQDVPVIGLAKRLEEIFIPGMRDPLMLSKSSTALRLLQQLRDEAHRFAITRQRMLRGKRQVKSKLDNIEGIGPAKRQSLLKAFGSIKRISAADIDDIAAVKGITKTLAEKIKTELNR